MMAVLATFADLPIVSPLGSVKFSDETPEQQARLARTWVGLGEITDRGLLHIRGNDAEAALQESAMKIGDVVTQDGLLARTRRDEFVLLTQDIRTKLDQLTKLVSEKRVTVIDITHGRCVEGTPRDFDHG